MVIASGSSPTTTPSTNAEYELESGLHPHLARTDTRRSNRSGRSNYSRVQPAFPFPAFHFDNRLSHNHTHTHLSPVSSLPPLSHTTAVSTPPPSLNTIGSTPPTERYESVSPNPFSDAATTPGDKTFVSGKTQSTFTWNSSDSTSSGTDVRHDRLVFDYRVLAQSMHAYRHLSIFRRFGRLSMANLLHYQEELTELENSLRLVDREEHRLQSTPNSDGEGERQLYESRLQLMSRLRELLKNYYEALLLQEQVLTNLEPPRLGDAQLLGDLAPPYPSSAPAHPLETDSATSHTDDLVSLGLSGKDSLEKLVGRIVPKIFPWRNPSTEDLRCRHMSSKDIASIFSPFTRRVTRLVIAIGTATLLLGPMSILQFMGSDNADRWRRLACISGFTVMLSLGIALGTRGRGEQIVMGVAAYLAVLVVFVQNSSSCQGGRGN
jgi:hypothetical protein